jgi:hypothetical protein
MSPEDRGLQPMPGRGRLLVDVVRPGKALVSGERTPIAGHILRDTHHEYGAPYYVENEDGRVIGTARTYKAGAEKLARHYGYQPGAVVVEHEWRQHGWTPGW